MRAKPIILSLTACLAMAACSGPGQPAETLTTDTDSTAVLRSQRTRNIFHSIPSPMETAGLLQKAGAEYDKSILNDVKNVDNYTSASKQALNLGIYGADLSYASVYNNTQESMLYTSCAQKLGKKLDINNAFNQEVVDRLEQNRSNRDSLLNIISETYLDVDGYLKENQRDNISALMVAGGWVEGLYIATQVCLKHDTPELRQRVAEQRLSLKDLLDLIRTYSPDDASVAAVLTDLERLDALFAGVAMPTGNSTVTQDGGVTVIGGTAPVATLTDEQLKSIGEAAASIRAGYIN
ncbi:MAG: hypothetical protein J5I62_04295 [Flavobacteriales bacterium]|nr:hypothetical protein [Flavobacteriales bacterium]MEB2340480.1 hypothetical protein [Flavobacteriia bacterium]